MQNFRHKEFKLYSNLEKPNLSVGMFVVETRLDSNYLNGLDKGQYRDSIKFTNIIRTKRPALRAGLAFRKKSCPPCTIFELIYFGFEAAGEYLDLCLLCIEPCSL